MKQQSRDNLRKEFGNHLRKWRRKLDLTQNAVASGAGIHVNFLSELERGVKSPTLETIYALAEALQLPPGNLLPKSKGLSLKTLVQARWIAKNRSANLEEILDRLMIQDEETTPHKRR